MIRVQPVYGPWQTLGVDLYPGLEPAGVAPTWGPSGPESLKFTLERPSGRVHTDLLPFTPVELYPGEQAAGDPVWSGYTLLAPPGGRAGVAASTTVDCVGWHAYREDEPRSQYWVHDDLSEWADIRSFKLPTAAILNWDDAGQVNVGGGTAAIGWQAGATQRAGRGCGLLLDLGPGNEPRRIVVDWDAKNLDGNFSLYARCTSALAASHMTGPVTADAFIAQPFQNSGNDVILPVVSAGSVVAGTRYIALFLYTSTLAGTTTTADHMAYIRRVRVFADAALEAGNESALTADRVIKDTRDRQTPLLSKDDSRIAAVSFFIPHAAWHKQRATKREIDDRVNDYHGYRLGVDELKRVFFLAQPSVPRLQVDANADGVEFADKSTNDGTEVYNHVAVTGRSGSGEELLLERFLADVVTDEDLPSLLGFVNPSFDVDTAGWTGATRDTTVSPIQARGYRSAPAGADLVVGATASMTGGTFKALRTYRLRLWVKVPPSSKGARAEQVLLRFGSATDYRDKLNVLENPATAAQWMEATVVWTPAADVAAAAAKLTHLGPTGEKVDDGSITEVPGGILGARGRTRSFTLNVAASTDAYSMAALAQAFLVAHRTTPFRADLAITADDVVTDLVAQEQVPADRLGVYYGEMVRVLGVPDPDTGALGARDGIIASVSGLRPASLALDSERRSLEAMMARMGVVKG